MYKVYAEGAGGGTGGGAGGGAGGGRAAAQPTQSRNPFRRVAERLRGRR